MDTDTGIVTSIDPARLPAYEQISCKPISEAVAALDAARAEFDQRRKDLVELEQTREQAEWRDARASETARAEHKPEPKRSHVSAHDRKVDDGRHQLKVAQLAAERAERALADAIERHGDEWSQEVEETCDGLLKQWHSGVAELTTLHARLAAALGIRRAITEGKQPRVGAVEFLPAQIGGREWAGGQGPTARPVAQVGDVLAAMAAVGTIAPEPEPVVQPPLPTAGGDPRLLGSAAVQAEISERRDREAATEARRAQLLAEQDAED
jgi:hypothetical protein